MALTSFEVVTARYRNDSEYTTGIVLVPRFDSVTFGGPGIEVGDVYTAFLLSIDRYERGGDPGWLTPDGWNASPLNGEISPSIGEHRMDLYAYTHTAVESDTTTTYSQYLFGDGRDDPDYYTGSLTRELVLMYTVTRGGVEAFPDGENDWGAAAFTTSDTLANWPTGTGPGKWLSVHLFSALNQTHPTNWDGDHVTMALADYDEAGLEDFTDIGVTTSGGRPQMDDTHFAFAYRETDGTDIGAVSSLITLGSTGFAVSEGVIAAVLPGADSYWGVNLT